MQLNKYLQFSIQLIHLSASCLLWHFPFTLFLTLWSTCGIEYACSHYTTTITGTTPLQVHSSCTPYLQFKISKYLENTAVITLQLSCAHKPCTLVNSHTHANLSETVVKKVSNSETVTQLLYAQSGCNSKLLLLTTLQDNQNLKKS